MITLDKSKYGFLSFPEMLGNMKKVIRNHDKDSPIVITASSKVIPYHSPGNVFEMFEDEKKVYERNNKEKEDRTQYLSRFVLENKETKPVVYEEYHGIVRYNADRSKEGDRKNDLKYKPLITLIDRCERLEKELSYVSVKIAGEHFEKLQEIYNSQGKDFREEKKREANECGVTPFL
jgi:hypothetical protein